MSDGANTAHIALEGQYTTAGFEGAYDQGSGTDVTYDAAHESGNFDQFHVTVAVDTNGTAGGAGGANRENVCMPG